MRLRAVRSPYGSKLSVVDHLDRETSHYKNQVALKFGELVLQQLKLFHAAAQGALRIR